jgi:proline racemase
VIALRTIDAHVGGQPLRLIVDGFPSPHGRTMTTKRDWLKRRADHLRRALMLEPRGHTDMCGAMLTEPVSPDSHAGVLFMNGEGYRAISADGIIAVTTIALERRLVMPGGDGTTIVYDTLAGPIRAHASLGAGEHDGDSAPRVERVSFLALPSFVLEAGLAVKIGARHIRADVAFGGELYAIVDAESAGLPMDAAHLPELRRVGVEIARGVEAAHERVHPLDGAMLEIAGTIFTGPPRNEAADLRNVTVFADGSVDRSACGTGTAAVMAVIDAMGMLSDDRPFVHESLIGTRLSGRLTGRAMVADDHPAIVVEIDGAAWITGEHTFLVDQDDPLSNGFRI